MMDTSIQNSVLHKLGFEILDIVNGVYRLRATSEDGKVTFDGVGILWAESKVTVSSVVHFCELNAVGGQHFDGAEMMLENWQNLDARRLISSGVASMPILTSHFGQLVEDNVQLERPNGLGARYIARMETGDIICYN